MSIEQQMFHVYRPSGFVGTMTLEAARQYAQHDPQALIEPAGQPRSKQARDVCTAAKRRERLQGPQKDGRLETAYAWMFVIACLMVVLAFYELWGVLR